VKKLRKEKAKMAYQNTIARKINLLTFALFLLAPFSFLSAQTTVVKPAMVPAPIKQKVKQGNKTVSKENLESIEKSMEVDPRVNIYLCVSEGKLKVNGWERNEIRASVVGGSDVGFKIQHKNAQSGAPDIVKILGFDPVKGTETGADECLSGEEIELDVPRGTLVNMKGSETETTIDSIRRAIVIIDGGDIFLNNIAQRIEARTFEGDITVENSTGNMVLTCTTGNIVAFDVSASEIGDVFKAKTSSGAITLQKVAHRQTEASSTSGSIRFNGDFQSGGQYNLGTQNGSILLSISEKSSFKLNASYGFGVFNTEIPLTNIVKNPAPRAQILSAQLGSGDAALSLKTVSGALRIKKQ
jgi:hypothetical protein